MELGLDDVDLADEEPSLCDSGSNVPDTTTSQLSAVCDVSPVSVPDPRPGNSPDVPAPLSDSERLDTYSMHLQQEGMQQVGSV